MDIPKDKLRVKIAKLVVTRPRVVALTLHRRTLFATFSMNPAPFNVEEFSKKSIEYYKEIQADLEAQHKGKYAALDYETKKYWIGETLSEAMDNAKKEFPEKLFYAVQVGSPSTFSVQAVRRRGVLYRKSLDGSKWIY